MAGAPFGVYGGRGAFPSVLRGMGGTDLTGGLAGNPAPPQLAGPTTALQHKGVLSEVNTVSGPSPSVHRLDGWSKLSHPQRLRVLRQVAEEYGRDPRMALFTVNQVLRGRVEPRDWPSMASALLTWVQTQIHYVNEQEERLQSPWRTIEWGIGDCDDQSTLLATLATSIDLPNRFVLQGRLKGGDKRKIVRYVEGTPAPAGWLKPNGVVEWFHITVILGWPAGSPSTWMAAEPTMRGAPLGYELAKDGIDMDEHGRPYLPGSSRSVPAYAPVPAGLEAKMVRGGRGQGGERLLGLGDMSGGPGMVVTTAKTATEKDLLPEERDPPWYKQLATRAWWNKVAAGTAEYAVGAVAVYFLMKRVEAWDKGRKARRRRR